MKPKSAIATDDTNPQFKNALELMGETREHIFLTGCAGTGKSTLIERFRNATHKNIAALAPTGVAALNIHGQTIHSFFHFGIDVTPEKIRRSSGKNNLIFKNLETLIIDEVSMVRADMLDCVDKALRVNRDNHQPFGGVQMIFVGDLYQLPPVVTKEENSIFDGHYASPYFFDARVMYDLKFKVIELTTVYRQRDVDFVNLLNAVRTGTVDEAILETINSRCADGAEAADNAEDFSVTLTTRTHLAEKVNLRKLALLPSKTVFCDANVIGDFKEKTMPTQTNLQLKTGAQIMLLNNDPRKRWVNGTLGKIIKVDKAATGTTLQIQLQNGNIVDVGRHTWEMTQYYFDQKAGKIDSRATGSFTQYPLKLAWAVTIHKSQGKTFDNVAIDVGEGAFAHGQIYVALSRSTTLEGITLRRPILAEHIFADRRIDDFLSRHR